VHQQQRDVPRQPPIACYPASCRLFCVYTTTQPAHCKNTAASLPHQCSWQAPIPCTSSSGMFPEPYFSYATLCLPCHFQVHNCPGSGALQAIAVCICVLAADKSALNEFCVSACRQVWCRWQVVLYATRWRCCLHSWNAAGAADDGQSCH
jgi:hypothetical protein